MATKRICLVPKDVMSLTGRSESSARRMVRKIKKGLGKTRNELLTIEEFCNYTKISAHEVDQAINR